MELKYEINVEDRIALIKCLYSLLILPGNDSGSQTLWASVLARLLKLDLFLFFSFLFILLFLFFGIKRDFI